MTGTLPTIQVKYSCGQCGIHRVVVDVTARSTEDVAEWMERILTPSLVRDHEARSPHCQPKSLTEVLIPVTGTEKIGGPVQN